MADTCGIGLDEAEVVTALCCTVLQVVGCLTGSGSSLEEVLAEHTHSPHMVVLCTQPPSPSASGSPQAVAAELLQVQEAHDRLAQLGKRHVTIYAAVPDGAGAVPTHRQLQSVQADVGTCGQLCQVSCTAGLVAKQPAMPAA